ncbi:MAG: helix-turn-helix domain-containing protein [Myxococcota bacterium]
MARQLIRAIRGRRSQEALSRRLGYSSNPVSDWEAGRRFPTAAETIRACHMVGIEVGDAFARFSPEEAPAIGDGDDAGVAAWLQALRGNTALKVLAERVGASRYAVSRWIAGDTRPRLPDFLRLVEALTGRLSDLLAELVDIDRIEALRAAHHQRHASKRIAFDEPWVGAVMCVIETETYQRRATHEPGLIARILGVDETVERRCLSRLENAGLIMRTGIRPYRTRDALTIDAVADPEGTKRLKAHWAAQGLARATAPHDGDMVSYNVVAVSREDLERIREAHIRYFMEVRSIVANSRPEVAALVNIQLLSWDEPE